MHEAPPPGNEFHYECDATGREHLTGVFMRMPFDIVRDGHGYDGYLEQEDGTKVPVSEHDGRLILDAYAEQAEQAEHVEPEEVV